MSKAIKWMNHVTAILGMMFLVFLVLDQFNPMMNFTDNDISRWMLAALCLSGMGQSLLHWGKKKDTSEQKCQEMNV